MTVIAAIYARISQDRDGTAHGTTRQVEDCQKKAAEMGWTVLREHIYVDDDTSATSSKPRPNYERMMDDLRNGTINAVVVWDVDRLTRQPMELEGFIKLVEELGVRLANYSGDIDLSTTMGKLSARIMGSLARAEAEKMSTRLKRQKLQRAQQGKPPAGGRYKTFGYTREWQIIESEAAVIRDAFRRTILGESLQSIADGWTAQGVDMGNGKPVRFSTVNNVLKRPLYAGITVHNGDVMGKSQVPAIISEATFNAAQAAMAGRPNAGKRGKNARTYLLAGVIRCGECLMPMGGGPTGRGDDYKYACRKAVGGCGGVSISGTAVESIVLFTVRHDLILRSHSSKATLVDYQPELDRIESDIAELRAARKAGRLSMSDAIDMIDDLSDERSEVQRKDAAQTATEASRADLGYAGWDSFMAAGISEQKALVGRRVKRVLVNKATKKTAFDPSRVILVLHNDVESNGATYWDQAKKLNPRWIVDGFREKSRSIDSRNRQVGLDQSPAEYR